MNIGAFLKLRISGENLVFDEISSILNVNPQIIHKKGEVHEDGYVVMDDSWLTKYEVPKWQFLDDDIIEFLLPFLSKKEFIVELTKRYTVTLWVSLYPKDIQMNVNFSSKVIEMLNELNIQMDITFLCLVDFYEGKV